MSRRVSVEFAVLQTWWVPWEKKPFSIVVIDCFGPTTFTDNKRSSFALTGENENFLRIVWIKRRYWGKINGRESLSVQQDSILLTSILLCSVELSTISGCSVANTNVKASVIAFGKLLKLYS